MKTKTNLAIVLMSFFFVIEANAFCIPEWIPFAGGYCFGEKQEETQGEMLWKAELLESPGNQIKVQGTGNVCDYAGTDKFEYCVFGE